MAEHLREPSGHGAVVTVGTYDGVHLGHQRLIREARREAERLGAVVVVVTFDRNPIETIRPDLSPKALTDLEFKLELLEATGIDEIVVLAFDQARASQSAEDFVCEELVEELGARAILVGSNFRFGYRRQGDVALLERLGKELGFLARGIDLVTDDESQVVVSSSRVRDLVAEGHLGEAAELLGRPHEVRGVLQERSGAPVLEVSSKLVLPLAGRYQGLVGVPGGRDGLHEVVARVLPGAPGALQLVELLIADETELPGAPGSKLALRLLG